MRRLGPLVTRQMVSHGRDLIKLAWHDPNRLTPEIVEYYLKPFKVDNWDRALWEFTLANHPLGISKRLDEITQPVLVITGDDDRIVPTRDSVQLAGKLPNASLQVIQNAGHLPHEEQPEAFMEAFISFINTIKLGEN